MEKHQLSTHTLQTSENTPPPFEERESGHVHQIVVDEEEGELKQWESGSGWGLDSSLFTIELHHSGILKWEDGARYVKGRVDYIDFCASEKINYMELLMIASKLGFKVSTIRKMYVKKLGECIGLNLEEIRHGTDISKHMDSNKVVSVYVETFTVSDGSGSEEDDDTDDEDYNVEEDEVDVDESAEDELEGFLGSDCEIGGDDELYETEVRGTVEVDPQRYEPARGDEAAIMCLGGAESDKSDGFESVDSDEGEKKVKEFERVDINRVMFKVGMRFKNLEELKSAVTAYALQEGKDLRYKRCANDKTSVVCAKGCEWKLFATRVKSEKTLRISSLLDKHSCSRAAENRQLKSRVIANLFESRIRNNPKWQVKDFRNEVQSEMKCKVSVHKAAKALRVAREKIRGSAKEQYEWLWDYVEEIKRSNPGTTTVLKVNERAGPNGEPMFKCLYICWASLRQGFMEGCRPVVGVDGCHLTGPYKGILLTAVAVDPNNCMYPFAYGVVNQENYKTWRWFLKLLRSDLNIQTGEYTFISDQQKGLVRAMEDILPGTEHRFCVRHLYNNFKQKHKGLVLKDLLWEAARATTVAQFNEVMERIQSIDRDAYIWLKEKPAEHWSKSHFRIFPKSDILLNNLCESFNAVIVEARGRAIVDMLEMIRQYLMEMIAKKKTAITRSSCIICPKIQKQLDFIKKKSHDWVPEWNGDKHFEVRGMTGARYVVDFESNKCGCRRWELTGIPCVHAVASIHYMGRLPEDYVHECYRRETYIRTYSHVMIPCQSKEQWAKTGKPKILPPPVTVLPGRPKKARRREPDENKNKDLQKASRVGTKNSCRSCGQSGHNQRTCPKRKKSATNVEGNCQGVKINVTRKAEASGQGDVEVELVVDAGMEVEKLLMDENVQAQIDATVQSQLHSKVDQNQVEIPTVHVAEKFQAQAEEVHVAEVNVNAEVDHVAEEFHAQAEEDQVAEEVHGAEVPAVQSHTEEIQNQVAEDAQMEVDEEENISQWSQTASQSSIQVTPKRTRPKRGIQSSSQEKVKVRRSQRIMSQPRKGPIKVSHVDLTNEEDGGVELPTQCSTTHAGIVKPPPPKLPKGQYMNKGKLYMSIEALKAAKSEELKIKRDKMKNKANFNPPRKNSSI